METHGIDLSEEGFESAIFNYFGGGGTFKDIKGLSNESMEAIYSIAYNFYQNRKYEEAQKIFQFLCFYDHFNSKFFMGLGVCQQMLKKYDKAIEIFTLATLLDKEDPRPLVCIGDCYLNKNNIEQAQEAYKLSLTWSTKKDKRFELELNRAKSMLENIAQ